MARAPRLVIGTTLKEQISTSFFVHLPALVAAGWEVHLVCAPGLWPSGQPPTGVVVHEIPMRKTISPPKDARALLAWTTLLREIRPAVVIGGSPKGALLAMTAAKLAGVPRRVYLHRGARWETLTGKSRAITRAADMATARAATDVVAVSPSLAQLLQSEGVTTEPALVLANGGSKGVDLQRFSPADVDGGQLRPPTLGFVGRFSADKGLDVALAALDTAKLRDPGTRLMAVGEVDLADPPTDEVMARVASDPSVVRRGWQSDVPAVLRQLDVLVFPSAREGLPNAVIEAAACGVPTVGWNVTGVRDAISDGHSGVLVRPGDAREFAAAAADLLDAVRAPDSPWSTQSREWATRFDQNLVTQAWLDLLGSPRTGVGVHGEVALRRGSLAVVVVTYRSLDTIGACVQSLAQHAPGCHLVIVDNSGQADEIQREVASAAPDFAAFASSRVINAPGNVGYARGVNLAVSLVPGDARFLLILNPDVVVTADPLVLVSGLSRADVTAGRLMGELPNANRATSYVSEMVRAVAGVKYRYLHVPEGSGDTYVPQLAGAYLLQTLDYYRSSPLDESFELYYEDVDYCDRARTARGVLLQDIVVGHHLGGASSGRIAAVPYVVGRVSRARYLRRRYPKAPAPLLQVPFALEFLVRGATSQAEGRHARRKALASVKAELRQPGSVRVLQDAPR